MFERVAPVVPVLDLHAALDRYRRLGFTVRAYGHGTGYGFADREDVSIHVSEWDEHDPTRTASVVYLYVTDAGPSGRNGSRRESTAGSAR
jgi:hypothetical protein